MLDLRNKRVTVAGLGRFGGGIAVSQWLVEQGAQVLVTDRDPAEKLDGSVKQLDGLPIEFRLGEHREDDFRNADLVVASPAIPPSNVYLRAARDAGVPVTTEICLFVERCPADVVGVTGTKGKSTTTAMLGLMLSSRYRTWVGGNIGKSLLQELGNIGSSDLVVLELSSFMLHYLGEIRWSPHMAIVTMISTDHTEWHGSAEAYVDAKKNIVRFQRPDEYAVLNDENPGAWEFRQSTAARIALFGLLGGTPFKLAVPGSHNQLNAQAAFTAGAIMGVGRAQAQAALDDFKGLPHRLEKVHESRGVQFFDDSIATIPEAAVAALDSFRPRSVIQIVGGYDKGLPLTEMCNALVERSKAALCIGATGKTIVDMMTSAPVPETGAAPAYLCGDLETAMKLAKQIAAPGDVVLLSTGCASYDQFTNFEERGTRFAALSKFEVG